MRTIPNMDATPERLASQMCLHARLAEAAVNRPDGWTGLASGEAFPLDVTVGIEDGTVLWVRFYVQSAPVTGSCMEVCFDGEPVYFIHAALERNRAAIVTIRFHTDTPAKANAA